MKHNRPRNKVDHTWACIGSNELNLSKLIKCILLDNPLYSKVFLPCFTCHARILENTCLSAKYIEEIYVLKSASFFDIDCDFRFQQEYYFIFLTLLHSPVK